MERRLSGGVWLVAAALVLAACTSAASPLPRPETTAATLRLESAAFPAQGTIPVRHTCDGLDLSPSLSWSEPPAGTQSLALICDDPDAPAGTWVHWLLFNMPATLRSLPEGVPQEMAEGGLHGKNSWGKAGYGGPCPPKGSTHRYFFRLYALDVVLDLMPQADKGDVEKAMAGHVLAEGQLEGRYGR